jgi:hypothetical protein
MSDAQLAELVSRWRRTAGDSGETLRRTRRLLADELENELVIDRSADLGALRLAADWRRYAERLRDSKRVVDDRLSVRVYGDLLEPESIESAEDQAELFDEAAKQLQTLIEGGRVAGRAKKQHR